MEDEISATLGGSIAGSCAEVLSRAGLESVSLCAALASLLVDTRGVEGRPARLLRDVLEEALLTAAKGRLVLPFSDSFEAVLA